MQSVERVVPVVSVVILVSLAWLPVPAALGDSPSTVPQFADREASKVFATEHFVFHSDFWMNLHDRLYMAVHVEEQPPVEEDAFNALSPEQRKGWREALSFYEEHTAKLHYRGKEMVAVRARILGQTISEAEEFLRRVLHHLEQAAPAYQAWLWKEQDRHNRAWIATVAPLVKKHEGVLTARLAKAYQHPWPESPIPVDSVLWGGSGGANTIVGPHHTMVSSVNPSYRNDAGLEMTFHEASHLLIGGRYGKVSEHLSKANQGRKLPRRDLWHTLLFYTTGEIVKAALTEDGKPGYVPYVYKQGLFDRAWPSYRKPLEEHWQPYLAGKVDLATAATKLVEAIHATHKEP